MSFKADCLPAAIGSLPHLNPQDGVALILDHLPEVPSWPQLPNCSYLESMYIQFSGGMPFLRLDPRKGRLHMEIPADIYGTLEQFYTRVLEDDLDYFAIRPEHARGLEAFIDRIWREKPEGLQWVKGQITGPISFGLMITDQRKRAILYNEEVFDTVLKSLMLKARWQVGQLKRLCANVIVFVDEPYLSSFGSAFINLTRDQVVEYLGQMFEAVHQEGALAGIHCCGNTDWSILMETDVDIINFDAFEYFQGLTLYVDELKGFIRRGGVLAWGIVPTSQQIEKVDGQSLYDNFCDKVGELAHRGIPKGALLSQSLITPSCGMGTLKMEQSQRVLTLLSEVSHLARSRVHGARRKRAG